MDFSNKTAISTGAASGMGFLFAENFASLGGNVVLCDVNKEALEKCVDDINQKGQGRAIGLVCDVRSYEEICTVRDKTLETFGSIDIVANFAGGYGRRMQKVDGSLDFTEVPIEVFDWSLDVNLKGPFYFAHAVLGQMKKQGSGLIINIGSITGAEGSGQGMDYPVAKALAVEVLAEHGFEPIGEAAFAAAATLMDACSHVLCCPTTFGTMNEKNRVLSERAEKNGKLTTLSAL